MCKRKRRNTTSAGATLSNQEAIKINQNKKTPKAMKKHKGHGPSHRSAEEIPEPQSRAAGLRSSLHSNIFQLKLLMLFLIRGIRLKYFNFRLITETYGESGKFDDLIFQYQKTPQSEYWYRYLQAKHRQSDDKRITEKDLLNEGDGDFSLQKYFRSYRNEIANRGRNVQDCIICTNIGFDQHVLESNDFNLTLIDSNDEILAFETEPNFGVPARYKFQQTKKLDELFRGSSELHQLAKKLLEFVNTSNKMTLKVEIFKIYHVALRKENVIDKNKFHRHFIEQNNLSQNISEFRDIIFKLWSKDNNNAGHSQFADFLKSATFNYSHNFGNSKEASNKTLGDKVTKKEIKEFLDKLVFAVNMPNEVRLGHILTKEVGQHFNVRGCDFQSSFILEKMLNWFKEKYSNPILQEAKDKTTTIDSNLFEETRQKMVALRATAFSIDFRANYLPSHFCESFQYQEETITQKAEELEEFLNFPEENKTLQISTKSLRCTTVKILSALDTLPRFKDSDDGYLLIESEHLERNKHMKEWVQGAMNEDKSHQVLVVIGETPVQVGSYEKELMPKDTQLRKKMIFICRENVGGTNDFERDEFGCELLSEKTMSNILSTVVTFQGSDVTIESLVGVRNGLNEMMDSSLIEEILFHQRKVIIPAFDSNEFEKSLWIDRFLLPPQISFDENTLNQLSKELKNLPGALNEKFHFHPEINHIEWLMENENEKCEILEKVQDLLKKNESNKISGHKDLIIPAMHEEKLVDQSTAIITGVAGSGKSTILSRHYEHVKRNNSNVWVIKINLINHSKYLSELKIPAGGSEEASTNTAIDILINFPGVTSQSEFARSLLKNRLKHSGGVVLMLDGFDEINFECQINIICLMKALGNGKTKLDMDRLIITTRPHLTEKLQKALFQLALSLEHLGKEHQVNYQVDLDEQHCINGSDYQVTHLDFENQSQSALEAQQNRMKIEVNVTEKDNSIALHPRDEEERPEKIKVDKKTILGMGTYSTVFVGYLRNQKVAVKRIPLYRADTMQREEEIIRHLKHPNVIQQLGVEDDEDFRYYALELVAGTLDDFCQGYYKGEMPSDGEALTQMTKGLLYIHGEKFVHRDIKPSNVLITFHKPVRLMITDVSSCEALDDTRTFSMQSGNIGNELWMAPEMIDNSDADDEDYEESVKRFSIACDTWALGCVFFYFLTRGVHPFGKTYLGIRLNVMVKQRPVELEKILLSSNCKMVEIYKLIGDMIDIEPQKRISLEQVLKKLKQIFNLNRCSNPSLFNEIQFEDGNIPLINPEIQDYKISPSQSEPGENDSDTGEKQGNGQLPQQRIANTTTSAQAENPDNTTKSEEKTPESSDRDGDEKDESKKETVEISIDCCVGCKKMETIEQSYRDVNRKVESANSKLGHLNESAIRTNLGLNEVEKPRNISSLYQLIECYGKAKHAKKWTDEDTHQSCKMVIKHLQDKKTDEEYRDWYYKKAMEKLAIKEKEKLEKISSPLTATYMATNKEETYLVTNIYRGNQLKAYIPGPIDWNEFTKPSGPIFLLALYRSIKHENEREGKEDSRKTIFDENPLLSFPPPGILTMDVPVNMSWGKSLILPGQLNENTGGKISPKEIFTTFIEVGEIKTSASQIRDAKLQLTRSLLCFKWLDQVISQNDTSYGLIGNIYIEGNSSEAQKQSQNKTNDAFPGEGITFKTRFAEYK